MQKELTGYPHIDKPWLQYYDEEKKYVEKEKRTVYQEVYENNKFFLKDISLEFFGSKISYSDFFKNINKTAKAFEEYGIKKGDFVTICSAGIPETVYSFYALSKIGAVANMIAPYFDKDDLVKRIEDCESDILIVMDIFYDEIKSAVKKSRIKNVIILPIFNSSMLRLFSKKYKVDSFSNELFWNQFIHDGCKRKEKPGILYEPQMPLAMVYSSGTTGASKGILLSNDSFQNSVEAYLKSGLDLSRRQKFYQIIPPWYSTGLSTSIHLPLSCGTTVFMDPRFERNVFVKNIIKAKPNYSVAPTSMYEGFLDEKLVGKADLSYFNHAYEGGEPLRKKVSDKIENTFLNHGNNSELLVGYGQCECGATVTTETPNTKHSGGSVGIPLPGVVVGIFDENFNALKYNERGLILVNTPCSMVEYYHNSEATDEYFHVDENGIKWNCTGDIGHIDENGELYVHGRATDFTYINGKKVYNFDIEEIIMSFDEVKLCDVLEKRFEDGEGTLVVHIIFEDDFYRSALNSDDLILNKLETIRSAIYNEFKDVDIVPNVFKIRTEFPYAKSGKRDMQKLQSETEGFIYFDKYQKSKQRILHQ
ncbi:MAG: class I adenylate-forming enzyme family protein [Bacilli bacterium]